MTLEHEENETTGARLIWELWRRCLTDAREAGQVPAGAVEGLIRQSREVLTERGCTKPDADLVLFEVYNTIHFDWKQPTDRIFETMLEFDLAEFFAERGINL